MINKLIIYKFFLSRTSLCCLIIACGDSNYIALVRLFASVVMSADLIFGSFHIKPIILVDAIMWYLLSFARSPTFQIIKSYISFMIWKDFLL